MCRSLKPEDRRLVLEFFIFDSHCSLEEFDFTIVNRRNMRALERVTYIDQI